MKESDLGERFHKAPKRNSADPVRRFKALCANSDRFNCTAKAIWTDGMVCKCTDEEKRNCGKKCKVFEPAILVDGCLIHSQMCDERALEQTRKDISVLLNQQTLRQLLTRKIYEYLQQASC